jgi:hypothetical protein
LTLGKRGRRDRSRGAIRSRLTLRTGRVQGQIRRLQEYYPAVGSDTMAVNVTQNAGFDQLPLG